MALSSRPRPRTAIGAFVGVLAVAVAVNVVADSRRVLWDLTAERSATLSEETLRVLAEVSQPVRITAAIPRDAPGRIEAATLLSRYRRANRAISWRIVDPVENPGVLEELRGMVPGSAAVTSGDQVEIAQFAIEIDLTSAIARLLRESPGSVCFTTGHGERSVDDVSPDGVGHLAALLEDNGYELRTIDLLASPQPPTGCDAVVVAAPTTELGERPAGALRDYLERAGKAFVLSDPATGVDLSAVTRRWGITFRRGIVLEANPEDRLRDDPASPIVRRYDGSNGAVRGLGPTFFPGAQAVVTEPSDRGGLSVAPIAVTSRTAYLETQPLEATFDPDDDLAGPITILAAADDSRVEDPTGRDPEIRRTRILASADADFASGLAIGEAANARLAIQAIDWLTQPEPLVSAVPNFPSLRELELTEARSRYIVFTTAGVVPGLFLIAGGFVWVFRRGR